MTDRELLHDKIDALFRRRRWLVTETCLAWTLTGAAVVAVGLVAAQKLHLVVASTWVWGTLAAAGVIAGLLWARACAGSPLDAAVDADLRRRLKERLSSALALAEGEQPMRAALIADAAEHARTLSPVEVYPRRFTRPRKAFVAAAVLAPLSLLLPEHDLRPRERRALVREMQAQAKKLEKLSKRLERSAREQGLPRTEEQARALAKLVKELQSARLAKREALQKVGKLSDAALKAHQSLAQRNHIADMQTAAARLQQEKLLSQAAREMRDSLKLGELSALERQLNELKQKLQSGSLSDAEREKLAADLEKLQQAMKEAGNAEMAKALEELAKAIRAGKLSEAVKQLEELGDLVDAELLDAADIQGVGELADALREAEYRLANSDQECECCQGRGGDCECGEVCKQCGGIGRCAGGHCPNPSLAACTSNGPGGPGPGGGSTNEKQATGPEGQQNRWGDTTGNDQTFNQQEYEEIYAPERTENKALPARARGQMSRSKAPIYQAPTSQTPGKSAARTPYYEVYESYRHAAAEALDKDAVPPAHRQHVRDYFDSLAPGGASSSAADSR